MMEDLTHTASLDGDLKTAPAEEIGMFRAVLDAMFCSGEMKNHAQNLLPPMPLSTTCAAAILTLVDEKTPLWLAPELLGKNVRKYLKFHTGATIVECASDAEFVVFRASQIPDLSQFQRGASNYHDRSATMIIQIDGPEGKSSTEPIKPNYEHRKEFSASGMNETFWRNVRSIKNRFPLGLEFVFCLRDGITACPRSSAIMLEETV